MTAVCAFLGPGWCSTNPDNFDFQRYSSLHAHADDLLEVLEELQVEVRATRNSDALSATVTLYSL